MRCGACLCSLPTSPRAWRRLAPYETILSAHQVQVLELEAERDALRMAEVHEHAPELWHIAPHPQDPRLLATVYNDGRLPPCLATYACSTAGMHACKLCGSARTRALSKPEVLCRGFQRSSSVAHAPRECAAGESGRAERQVSASCFCLAPGRRRCRRQPARWRPAAVED